MIQHAQIERPQADGRPAPRAEAVFKPLALPALAAAVHATRSQPRSAAAKDLPPILRKEAVLG